MAGGSIVLVVDDDLEQRARAVATLEGAGYRVVAAADGEEAVAITIAEPPDGVLMDVSLPKLDGIAACERIRTLPRGGEIAVIFITGQHDVAIFDRALAAGGDDFMTRPFHATDLLVRVQTALQWRRHARDRTELDELLKRQRDRLQRVDLVRQQLVEFFVHDLKAPVSVTDLYAQLIERCVDDRIAVVASAKKIQAEARGLAAMIMNLLDLSKADQAPLQPKLDEIDAPSLVREVVERLDILACGSAVTITIELHASVIRADRHLLTRVLVNLIDNAIRHSPEGSPIRVEVATRDDRTEIRVTDRGPGIPLQQRTEVFERFTNVDKPNGWNRGLGLAFCKLAVEAHGGQIWIEDASPGAVFCVRI